MSDYCWLVVTGEEMVTSNIPGVAQRGPFIELVLGTRLPGIEVATEQLFGAEEGQAIHRKHFYRNGRFAGTEPVKIRAVYPCMRPGWNTGEPRIYKLCRRVATFCASTAGEKHDGCQ